MINETKSDQERSKPDEVGCCDLLAKKNTWVSIDTQPRHYVVILVLDNGTHHLAHRVLNEEGYVAIETGVRLNHITHWLPIPIAPENLS